MDKDYIVSSNLKNKKEPRFFRSYLDIEKSLIEPESFIYYTDILLKVYKLISYYIVK